jgi:hypothetical protein
MKMTALIAVFASVISSIALADGIPVPMNEQTPYNWTCSPNQGMDVSLHFMTIDSTLFIRTQRLGATGLTLPAKMANALLEKNYAALDGKRVSKAEWKRAFLFEAGDSSDTLNITYEGENLQMRFLNCAAEF